jgi:hypothetical protein
MSGALRGLGSALLALGCAVALGCGARTSLSDLAPVAGTGGSSGASSAGAAGTSSNSAGSCGDLTSSAANCGACGQVCAGTCMGGRCLVTLAVKQNNVGCLAVDAHDVYWATADLPSNGTINRSTLSGSGFSSISMASPAPWPCTMAVDDMFAYWANGSSGVLQRARIRGGVAQTLSSGLGAEFLAIGGETVYFTGQFAYPSKVPSSGGTATRLGDARGAAGMAIDRQNLYWTVRDGASTRGDVLQVPLAGGAVSTLAQGEGMPQGIAADDAAVYWANNQSGEIRKLTHAGGAITTLTAGEMLPTVLAIDEASVYWSALGGLRKVAKSGGTAVTLAATRAFDIKLDATSVYWTDGTAVMKLTPK